MPINYASRIIKEIKIKKTPVQEKRYFFEQDKNTIDRLKIQKQIFENERHAIRNQARKKAKEIQEVESIDLSKALSGLNLKVSSKTSKKEINELIRKELASLKEIRKENKESIAQIEVKENVTKSLNIIFNRSLTPEKSVNAYKNLISILENISRVQFGNNKYKKNIFLTEALKQIENQLQASKNIEETVREIHKKLKKAISKN